MKTTIGYDWNTVVATFALGNRGYCVGFSLLRRFNTGKFFHFASWSRA